MRFFVTKSRHTDSGQKAAQRGTSMPRVRIGLHPEWTLGISSALDRWAPGRFTGPASHLKSLAPRLIGANAGHCCFELIRRVVWAEATTFLTPKLGQLPRGIPT